MDTEVLTLVEDLMDTMERIVTQLKTQQELNVAIVDKLKAMENYDYLEG